MGAENANPLDELRDLGRQIDRATDLEALKPVFARVDQLAKLHSGDLEVQLATEELKQRIVDRGKTLRQLSSQDSGTIRSVPPIAPPILEAPVQPEVPPIRSIAMPPPVSAPPSKPPATEAAPGVKPAAAKERPGARPSPRAAGGWKRPLIVGILVGSLLSIALIAFLVKKAKQRSLAAAIQVKVATVPAGASIRVNGEARCDSDCTVALVPGSYQVMAFLDGYEPAAATLNVQPGKPASVSMALEAARQSLRILTDLPQGKVVVDGQPPLDLQDGQFALDRIQPGPHTVKITSRNGEATFTMNVEQAKLPSVDGPIAVKNLLGVAAATMGNKARIYTSGGPLKLAVNGAPQGDVSPAGRDLTGYQPGVTELTVGEGKDQKVVTESFGPSPTLTVFLKSDLNIGTLIVSTGEDDVRVFLNDKEYQRRTKRGQIRIPTIGNVSVRVAKEGFEPVQAQIAEIKKGGETRLEFKLQASPKFAALQLRGGTPGAEVFLDQKSVGTIADDGSFANNAVPPGDHTIELRRDQYLPKRFQRSFRAGQNVVLTAVDVVLTSALGTVRVARTPADAAVTYRRADETQGRELRGAQVELQPGSYVFTARAPGFSEKSERVQVSPGEIQSLEIALARVVVAAAAPPPKAGGMADFENSSSWSQQGDVWSHRGGGLVPYKAIPNGVFTFTIQLLKGGNLFRGAKIRWVTQYIDGKNYNLFELDRKSLSSKVVINGKTFDRGKFDHNLSEKDKAYTIQIDSRREHLVTRFMVGGEWKTIDSWDEADRDFTAGKFGFLIQGSDEIGLTDFKFAPR